MRVQDKHGHSICLPAIKHRLQRGIHGLHVRDADNHPRLAIIVAVFGKSQVVRQINGGMLDFVFVVSIQHDVAVNGRGINPIKILLNVIYRIFWIVEAIIGLKVGEIERAPVTVHHRITRLRWQWIGVKPGARKWREKIHQTHRAAMR